MIKVTFTTALALVGLLGLAPGARAQTTSAAIASYNAAPELTGTYWDVTFNWTLGDRADPPAYEAYRIDATIEWQRVTIFDVQPAVTLVRASVGPYAIPADGGTWDTLVPARLESSGGGVWKVTATVVWGNYDRDNNFRALYSQPIYYYDNNQQIDFRYGFQLGFNPYPPGGGTGGCGN